MGGYTRWGFPQHRVPNTQLRMPNTQHVVPNTQMSKPNTRNSKPKLRQFGAIFPKIRSKSPTPVAASSTLPTPRSPSPDPRSPPLCAQWGQMRGSRSVGPKSPPFGPCSSSLTKSRSSLRLLWSAVVKLQQGPYAVTRGGGRWPHWARTPHVQRRAGGIRLGMSELDRFRAPQVDSETFKNFGKFAPDCRELWLRILGVWLRNLGVWHRK